MAFLRQFNIQARLWSILLVSLVVLLIIAFLSVNQLKESMYLAKDEKNKNLVEVASGVFEYFHEQELNGQLTREQAQTMAKALIKKIRYAETNYFWVNDYQANMVMHPIKPETDGKDMSGFKDSVGDAIYTKFAQIAREKGQGRYEYFFIKPGAGDTPLPKFSHVKGFKPWEWVIGTGAYVDDVDEQYGSAVMANVLLVVVFVALMGALLFVVIRSITVPIFTAKEAMADIATGSGDLRSQLKVEGNDELSALSVHFNEFVVKIRDTINTVESSANKLTEASSELLVTSEESNQSVEQQNEQITQVASAVKQLTYSLQEVSDSAKNIAEIVSQVDTDASRGVEELTSALSSLDSLTGDIDSAVDVITSLATQTESIGNVLNVIREIADQTNLLALNAAIEAARAGEQGRGFAVVADEVRTLASRTQQSTEEIDQMIVQLQDKGKQAVSVIETSQKQSIETVSQASDAKSALTQISNSVSALSGIGDQNAVAVGDQNKTVDEINQSVTSIHNIAQKTQALSSRTASAGQNVETISAEIERNLSRFSK